MGSSSVLRLDRAEWRNLQVLSDVAMADCCNQEGSNFIRSRTITGCGFGLMFK